MKRRGIQLVVVALLGLGWLRPAALAQFIWIGASTTSNFFNAPANWQGGSVPTGSGTEDVTFGALTGTRNTIDLPDVALRHLTFAAGRPAYHFDGDETILTLNGNLTAAAGSSVTFTSLVITSLSSGSHVFDIAGPATDVRFNGAVSGPGSLLKTGSGKLTFMAFTMPGAGTTIQGGTVDVDGGSLVHAGANLVAGLSGGDNATVLVQNGGGVTTDATVIGMGAGSIGAVTVTGGGSTWQTLGSLEVGAHGTGSLSILNGAGVDSAFGALARHSDGIGIVSVSGSGSIWSLTGTLVVGEYGIGTLAVANGGTVQSNFASIATLVGSLGTVSVDGAGSHFAASAELDVGASSIGFLSVTNGGTATTNHGFIGNASGAVGLATIDGPGSAWTNLGSMTIGYSGMGSLTLANGSALNVGSGAGTIFIGGAAGGHGTLNLGADSASPAAAAGRVNAATVTTGPGTAILQFNTLGTSGTPYYFTKDATSLGGAISIGGLTQVINTSGVSVLTGANTYLGGTYVNGGELRAETNTALGAGPLVFSSGSNAKVRFATTAPVIGSLSGSAAGTQLLLTQNDSILTVNQSTLGSFHGEIRSTAPGDSIRLVKSGNATLRLESGGFFFHNGVVDGLRGGAEISVRVTQGTLLIASGFFIEDNAPTIWINGGTLALENKTIANPVVVDGGGILAGNGTLSSAFTLGSGGVLSPGFSPGTFTFSNGLTLDNGGSLNFDVQSAFGAAGTGYDTVNISGGLLDLSALGAGGFTLNAISLNTGGTAGNVSDFSPASAYSWTVFNSTGGITGFSAGHFGINTASFSNSLGGGSFSLSQMGNQIRLDFTPVPEPSTWVLLFAGSCAIAVSVKRRRRT